MIADMIAIELASLRDQHAVAVACGLHAVALDIAADIADLVQAADVLTRRLGIGAVAEMAQVA